MVIHIRSMDISRYRNNYEGFYEKFTYLIFINSERMTTTQGGNSPFCLFLS